MIERYDVVIVGGGMAGLSAAHRLHQHAPQLNWRLFEASERFGGKVRTDYVDHDDGRFVIEAGPDSFVAQKPWLRELATDLGLAADLVPTNHRPHPVAILKRGRLIDLPAGVALVAPTEFGPTSALRSFPWLTRSD